MATVRSRLRVIRENTQALQRTLAALGGSDAEFAAEWDSARRLWDQQAGDIDRDLAALAASAEADATGDTGIEDEIEFVRNTWDEAKEGWTKLVADHASPDIREVRIAAIQQHLIAMVNKIGFLTIPARVVEYLGREREGGAFDFNRAFVNEMPDPAERVRLLEYLAESPKGLGIIDVKRGLIWRVEESALRQGLLAGGAIFVLGAIVARFAHELASLLGLEVSLPAGPTLALTFILVGAGVIGHIAVDFLKASRSDEPASPTAQDDLVLWGALHQRQIIATSLAIWAGTVILVASDTLDPLTALLAGYSLDSVLDVGLKRFEAAATKGVKDLTDRLATTGAAA